MTYRVYIRNDSKAEIHETLFPKHPLLYTLLLAPFFIVSYHWIGSSDQAQTSSVNIALVETQHSHADTAAAETETVEIIEAEPIDLPTLEPSEQHPTVVVRNQAEKNHESGSASEQANIVVLEHQPSAQLPEIASQHELLEVIAEQQQHRGSTDDSQLQKISVKKGDSMAMIFNRLSLSPQSLHEIMTLGKETAVLKSIMPGQIIEFEIKKDRLHSIKYDYALTKTLVIKREDHTFKAETIETEIEKRLRYASASINSSLFLAGQSAGITDKVIMNLVSIYGWDIDFALDIRNGDKFAILYEEHFKNDKKIANGPILAAEFINQGHRFRAVRYKHKNGDVNYYSDTGHNMRKAFIRTPVNFSRISSRFNLKRKHPVLNKIRAHRGVDYAARTGTPIKASGDGIVSFKGTKGGYGRTIILKHGGTYTTLYAHMSKYAKGIRNGVRVKQGQTIGYVGKSGLATGPHLHYEFRINGVHRNPLKVKLPKALKIPDAVMADFKQQTQPILAQLDQFISESETLASLPIAESEQGQILAMRKTDDNPDSITQ